MKLLPCPFCEGPPCPSVTRAIGGGMFHDSELIGDDGLYVTAHVFCHECGVKGPYVMKHAYCRADCDDIEREVVDLWQERSRKNRNLYDGGELDGLNEYPRAEVEEV